LQNKFYGHKKGKFYEHEGVNLWMPSRLLKTDDIALNYISATKGDTLFLAFTNQSRQPVKTNVTINPTWVNNLDGRPVLQADSKAIVAHVKDSLFRIEVPANGISSVAIIGGNIHKGFQQQILKATEDHR